MVPATAPPDAVTSCAEATEVANMAATTPEARYPNLAISFLLLAFKASLSNAPPNVSTGRPTLDS